MNLNCAICGGENNVRALPACITGSDVLLCFTCFEIWYDDGVTDTKILRERSLAKQGRSAATQSADFLRGRILELEKECAGIRDILFDKGQIVAAAQMSGAEADLHKTLSVWNHEIIW